MAQKPDYGIDAPGVIRNLLGFGLLSIVLSFVVPPLHVGIPRNGETYNVVLVFSSMFRWMGGGLLLEGVLMVVYVKYGKFVHRDRMLNMISWRGDERVLDVGTGRGLLLIGAAKRLTTGKGIGIDIWSTKDLSGNAIERAQANVDLEGVKDKVELLSEDACKLSFPDASFDVVLSNLCIHNIPKEAGRKEACREIARVLKPGGIALISDYKNTARYQKIFEEAGLNVSRTGYTLDFPPLRVVRAGKS